MADACKLLRFGGSRDQRHDSTQSPSRHVRRTVNFAPSRLALAVGHAQRGRLGHERGDFGVLGEIAALERGDLVADLGGRWSRRCRRLRTARVAVCPSSPSGRAPDGSDTSSSRRGPQGRTRHPIRSPRQDRDPRRTTGQAGLAGPCTAPQLAKCGRSRCDAPVTHGQATRDHGTREFAGPVESPVQDLDRTSTGARRAWLFDEISCSELPLLSSVHHAEHLVLEV